MKIEEIWRAWKSRQNLKNYLIFFLPSRQAFYKAYETDAEIVHFLFGFKIVAQGTTRYAGFPRESGKKYFSILQEAGYPFLVVEDKNGNDNWIGLVRNDGNKSIDITIPTSTIKEFYHELNGIIDEGSYNENNLEEIPFKTFYQKLKNIEELVKKYELSKNIITSQIVSENIPTLDISNVKSDIDILDDNIQLDFQNNSNNN